MKRNNDRMLLESLVRKYGKNGVMNAINKLNESEEHTVILYDNTLDSYDKFRDAYDEDVEVGDIDPDVTSYDDYSERLFQLEAEDFEEHIKRYDLKQSYPTYYYVRDLDRNAKYPNDAVYDDLWDAIYSIIEGDYCIVKYVDGHIEITLLPYNSQRRVYYDIYMLNPVGIDIWEEESDTDLLNNSEYWKKMEKFY